jgi:hypothetical protein
MSKEIDYGDYKEVAKPVHMKVVSRPLSVDTSEGYHTPSQGKYYNGHLYTREEWHNWICSGISP